MGNSEFDHLNCARCGKELRGGPLDHLTEEDRIACEEMRQRFLRAGGCPICGSPPGMPCDPALHS